MEPLLRLERWLDTSLSRTFARLFRSPIDPVELAAALRRECDDKATLIRGQRKLVPNEFLIELHEDDFKSINIETLESSLTEQIDAFVAQQGYSIAGPIKIAITPSHLLTSGLYALRSASLADLPTVIEGPITLEVGVRRIGLKEGVFRIGRDDSMDLRLDDPGISRHHCDIEIKGGTITVHDHNSTNGTLVNGVAVTRGLLVDGSRIRLGGTDLIIHSGRK